MSMRDSFNNWTGNKPDYGSISEMHDSNITGLKLITDDESVMMNGYVQLPDAAMAIRRPEEDDLIASINDSTFDEENDEDKYKDMANEARELGRHDIALALDIISHEEHNHLKILEALIPKSGLSEEDFADLPNEIIKQTAMRSQ